MDAKEFKEIRKRLELNQNEMAELLGLTDFKTVSNIEIGDRNPNKLAIKFLRYLNSLTLAKAKKLIEEINKFQ